MVWALGLSESYNWSMLTVEKTEECEKKDEF